MVRMRLLMACVMMGLLASLAWAEEGGADQPKPKKPPMVGKVTAVAADSITVEFEGGDSKTWAVNADTKVKVNGKAATIEDVKTGMYAVVRGPKDDPAKNIMASDEKPAPGGGDKANKDKKDKKPKEQPVH